MAERSARDVVERYLEHVNAHDIDAAMALLHPEFELEFVGGPTLPKAAVRKAAGWDVGTRGRVEFSVESEGADAVVVEGRESNAFLELLGAEPMAFTARFQIHDGGLVTHQLHRVHASGPPLDELMEPAVEWAREHAPGELAEIYPDGQLSYSEEMGRRWVALLERWRRDAAPERGTDR